MLAGQGKIDAYRRQTLKNVEGLGDQRLPGGHGVSLELGPDDVIVVGGPSPLSTWGFDLIRVVVAKMTHAQIYTVDRTDPVEEVPARADGLRAFCFAQYPSPSLTRIIRNAHVPTIAFLDDPVASVRYLKELTACTLIEALRAQTAAATVYSELHNNRSVTLITRSASRTTGSVAVQLFKHLGIEMDSGGTGRFIEKFSLPLADALFRHIQKFVRLAETGALSSEEASVINQVLAPMMQMAVSRDAEPICWPASVFLFGDRPNNRPPPVAELTGPARIIFYGPYFHLPAGRWQVRVILSLSGDPGSTRLSIEVHGTALVAKALVNCQGEGTFQASFALIHHKPEDALELRIRIEEGAIEGRVSLSRVELAPQIAPEH